MHETTESENKNKKRTREEVQRDLSHELRDWLQEFRENLDDESTSTEPWETQSREVKTLPSHLMNFQWSASKSGTGFGCQHSVYTHFPKDPNCGICLKTKNNKGLLQKTCWYSRAQSGTFW